MEFKAFKDNVFVLPEKHARRTDGGIVLPDSVDGTEFGDKMRAGEVIDVGPGGVGNDEAFIQRGADEKYFGTDGINPGDRVLYPADGGDICIIGSDIPQKYAPEYEAGTELRILRADEIEAVIG